MSRLSGLNRLARRPLIAVAVTSALLAGTAPLACSIPVSAGAKLQNAMNAFVVTKGGSPGIVVAIGQGKKFTLRTAGVANVVTKAKPLANSQMRMASVAKAFSGAAALSLVSRGKLKLADTVGKIVPKMPAAWKNITLAQLLQHTSGIPDLITFDAFKIAVGKSPQVPPAPRVLLSYVTNPTLLFPAGTKYHYSNSDNMLVALMIQNVTNRSYAGVLASNVYAPLGLKGTSLPVGSAMGTPTLRGYDISTKPLEDDTNLLAAGWSWASGGIVSTPADALAFVRGYVRGALFNKATRAAQFTFRPGNSEPTGPGTNYAGLGLFKYVTSCGTFYGHTGNTPGYTQFVASTADGSRGATVSINAQITPNTNPAQFPALRNIFQLAVCATK